MTDLTPIAPKLAKLLPRLATEADGGIIATVAAIRRTLAGHGADLHDLAAAVARPPVERSRVYGEEAGPQPLTPAGMVTRLWACSHQLTPRELDFIGNLQRQAWRGAAMRVTPKQRAWLEAIHARVIGEGEE